MFDLTGEDGFDKPEVVRGPAAFDIRLGFVVSVTMCTLIPLLLVYLTPAPNHPAPTHTQIQISNTYQLALALATSATKLAPAARPRAYVRLQQPFYEMKSAPVSAPGHSEKDKLKPDGIRGRWWHETLRGIAKLDALNFGIVRCAAFYGSGAWDVQICPRLVCGHVYSYL